MLRVSLFGGLRLEGPAGTVAEEAVEGAQARVVLAFLATRPNRVASRDELGDALWPEELPGTWEVSLRNAVTKARRALATVAGRDDDVLTSRSGAYRLVTPELSVDAVELAALIDRAELALRDGDHRLAGNLAKQAIAVLRQPMLPGWTFDWVDQLRLEADRLGVTALEVAAEASLAAEDHAAALDHAEDALRREPFREPAHRVVMRAHLAAGSRGEALQAYERCRRLLDDELGVRPSPETEALYLELLGEEPAAAPAPAQTRLRATAPVPRPVTATFAGRKAELDAIAGAVTRAEAGRGQVVLIGGPAGMGKTTLALQGATAASGPDRLVLYGRCGEDAVVPYEPFVEAFERVLADLAPDDLGALVEAGGSAVLRVLPGVAARVPHLVAPSSRDPDSDRALVLSSLVGMLGAVAGDRTAVLVVDDLHWAAEPTLLALRHLVHTVRHEPVSVIVTYRDDEIGGRDDVATTIAAIGRGDSATAIRLDGLTRADLDQLAGAHSSDEVDVVFARSGGHPLFATALLDAAPEALSADVPESVAAVVAQQRRRLSDGARKALGVVAVLGMDVDLEILQEVTGAGDDQLVDLVEELTGAGLLTDTGTHDRYRVRHAIVRDAAYLAVEPARRAVLHRVVAEALERCGRTTSAADLGNLAHHYGATIGGNRPKAVAYAVAAGDRALEMAAFEDAERHFQDALAWVPEAHDTQQRVDLLVRLGDAQRRAGEPGGRSTLLDAARMAARLGYVDGLANAALANGGRGYYNTHDNYDEERVGCLRAALDALGDEASSRRARLLAQLAIELAFRAPWTELVAMTDEALRMVRQLDDPALVAEVLLARIIAVRVPQTYGSRLEDAEELQRLTPFVRDPYAATTSALWRSRTLLEHGRMDDAATALDEATTSAERLDDATLRWQAASARVGMLMVDGRLEDAERLLQEARALGEATGDPRAVVQLVPRSIAIAVFRDDPLHGTVDDFLDYLQLVERSHTHRAGAAFVLAYYGEPAAGRELLAPYDDDLLDRLPMDRLWLPLLWALGIAADFAEHAQVGRGVLRLLEPFAGQHVETTGIYFGPAEIALGSAAIACGDLERARTYLERSHTILAAVGDEPWTAWVRYRLGSVLARAGRPADARTSLDQAVELARRVGATELERRAGAERAALAEEDPSRWTAR